MAKLRIERFINVNRPKANANHWAKGWLLMMKFHPEWAWDLDSMTDYIASAMQAGYDYAQDEMREREAISPSVNGGEVVEE